MLGSCQTLPDDYDTAEPDVSEAPPYVVVSTPYTGESVARGVAARIDIKRGSLVEKAHCLLVPQQQYEQHARHTVFEHYLFHGKDGQMLLALGVGSLFNHSRQPNLDYRIDHSGLIIRYYACKDIEAGEELTIYYGGKLWFADGAAGGTEAMTHEHMDDEQGFLNGLQL